jgi:hypothetical protein
MTRTKLPICHTHIYTHNELVFLAQVFLVLSCFLRAQVLQMIFNRKERSELLEGMVISDEDADVHSFRQVITAHSRSSDLLPL